MPTNNQPTNQKQLVVSMLQDARALIDAQGSWSKLALCRDQNGKRVPANSNDIHSYCIYGALLAVSRKSGGNKTTFRISVNVLNKLCRIIYGKGIKKYGSEEDWSEFGCFPLNYTNDSLIKNQAEAQRLLNVAIKSLDKKLASKPGQAQATPPAKPEAAKATPPPSQPPPSQPSGMPAEQSPAATDKAVIALPESEATPPLPTAEVQLGQPEPEAQPQLAMVDEEKPELPLAATNSMSIAPAPEQAQATPPLPAAEVQLGQPEPEAQSQLAMVDEEKPELSLAGNNSAPIAPAPEQAMSSVLTGEGISLAEAHSIPPLAPLQADIAPLQIEEPPAETGSENMLPSDSGTQEPQQPASYQLPDVSELEVQTNQQEQAFAVNSEAETAVAYTESDPDITADDEYTVMDISHKPVLLNEHKEAESTPDDLIEIDIDVSEDKDNN